MFAKENVEKMAAEKGILLADLTWGGLRPGVWGMQRHQDHQRSPALYSELTAHLYRNVKPSLLEEVPVYLCLWEDEEDALADPGEDHGVQHKPQHCLEELTQLNPSLLVSFSYEGTKW